MSSLRPNKQFTKKRSTFDRSKSGSFTPEVYDNKFEFCGESGEGEPTPFFKKPSAASPGTPKRAGSPRRLSFTKPKLIGPIKNSSQSQSRN